MSSFGEHFGIDPEEEARMSARARYGAAVDRGQAKGHLGLAMDTAEQTFDVLLPKYRNADPETVKSTYPLADQYAQTMNRAITAHVNGDRNTAVFHAMKAHGYLVAIHNDMRRIAQKTMSQDDQKLLRISHANIEQEHQMHINNYLNAMKPNPSTKASGICRNCSTMRDTNGKCKGC